jgi:predicted helicase
MSKPPGKQLGYVILPIAITAGLDPAAALDKNADYDAIWEVLQALRAHDERFNAYINRIALSSTKPGTDPDDPIKVIPVDIIARSDHRTAPTRRGEHEIIASSGCPSDR